MDDFQYLLALVFFIAWIIASVMVAVVAKSKQQSAGQWFATAFFLSPIFAAVLLCAVPTALEQAAASEASERNYGSLGLGATRD